MGGRAGEVVGKEGSGGGLFSEEVLRRKGYTWELGGACR